MLLFWLTTDTELLSVNHYTLCPSFEYLIWTNVCNWWLHPPVSVQSNSESSRIFTFINKLHDFALLQRIRVDSRPSVKKHNYRKIANFLRFYPLRNIKTWIERATTYIRLQTHKLRTQWESKIQKIHTFLRWELYQSITFFGEILKIKDLTILNRGNK